jgi:hypothetical protein
MGTVKEGKGRIEGNVIIAYKDAKMYGYIYSLVYHDRSTI